ncbi:MAG: sulfite exporter TauE/SafE family protein [Gammaproteobacteria bacterium]
MFEIFLFSLLLGGVAGLLAGLFGIGGGLVIVPALSWVFAVQGFDDRIVMVMAVATSLATILATSTASIYAHHRHGSIDWSTVCQLTPGILAGAVAGSFVADALSSDTLRALFAVFLFSVGLQMLLQFKLSVDGFNLSRSRSLSAGCLIGMVSAVLGIGGGTLTVPLLLAARFTMRGAVGISSACGLPIAVAGTVSYAVLGWSNALLPEGSAGYVYVPAFAGIVLISVMTAQVGAVWANRLPTAKLKRYFSVLIFVVAAKLLY